MQRIVVTADDFGLSRGNTDTILKVADYGMLTRVSLLPNGLDFDHAASEYKKRADRLELSAHLNITEGRPLSNPAEVSRLVDARGFFKRSPLNLLIATICTSVDAPIRKEIRLELSRQIHRVHSIGLPFSADAHQHVHMVPAVFRELLTLAPQFGVKYIRIPHEPVAVLRALFTRPLRSFSVFVLDMLSARNMACARGRLDHNDFFIGVLYSGALNEDNVRVLMRHIPVQGTIEIATHPGSALPNELDEWGGDTLWQYHPNRAAERRMLMSEDFRTLVTSERRGASLHVSRIMRFTLAGSAAAATHLTTLFVFTEYAGVWYLASSVIGWCLGFAMSFTLQKLFTFDDRTRVHGRQLYRYFALQCSNLVLNTCGVYLFTSLGLWYMASQFLVLLSLATWSYFISSRLIFTHFRIT